MTQRVLRGSSYLYSSIFLRAAYRSRNPPENRFYHIGFRLIIRMTE